MNTSKRFQCILSGILVLWLGACHDGSSNSNKSQAPTPEPVQPTYDFAAVDSALGDFIDNTEAYSGASIIIEHKTWGIIFEAAYGDYTLDTVAGIASQTKTATASLLMALASDPDLDFDIDRTMEEVLPWGTVYPSITTAHLLSQTSGLPGIGDFLAGNPLDFGPHMCMLLPFPGFPFSDTLRECAQIISQFLLQDVLPPGTAFRYGFTQWQLAGGVAEVVGGATWAQLMDQYVSGPCGLETLQFANVRIGDWDGNPDSLTGQENPNLEGGAIASVRDILGLASLQLHDGACGDTQVLSESALLRMREDVGSALGSLEHVKEEREPVGLADLGYGMGWWIRPTSDGSEPSVFLSGGGYGAQLWFDLDREYSAAILVDNYTDRFATLDMHVLTSHELTPLIEEAIDTAQ